MVKLSNLQVSQAWSHWRSNRWRAALVSGALATGLSPSIASAQVNIQLILDASGSMYNKLPDERYRITAAKSALRTFIGALPSADVNVGLRVYGGERSATNKQACEDSRLVVPMESVDKPALLGAVNAVRAKGSTPIAFSLDQAALDLAGKSGRCLVVLVTDGKEVCGGDLRASAENLKKIGCEVDLRIVGLDLSEEAKSSFKGLGHFDEANNTAELAGALERAVDTVVERGAMTAATLEAEPTVAAGKEFPVSWSATPGAQDYVTIVPKGAKTGAYASYAYVDTGNPVRLYAPISPGAYELRYQSDRVPGVAATRTITVTPTDTALEAPQVLPAGKPFKVGWIGPNGKQDYITIVKSGAADGRYGSYKYTSDGSPLRLHAPIQAGRYELRYQSDRSKATGKVFARRPVVIEAANISLDAPAQAVAASTIDVEWVGPNGDGDYITIVPADAPAGRYTSYAYTKTSATVKILVPPSAGQYEVRYQSDRESGVFARLKIEVKGVEASVQSVAQVPADTEFKIDWTGPDGRGDYITIVPAGSPAQTYHQYAYTSAGSPVTLKAPALAGEYEIRYRSGQFQNHIFARGLIRVQ